MATSAPNTTPDPRPTGDLEQLFRQKFAEAEVTPRAGLWEQLDHELLVEQNNTFRRRLGVHRWVAAACLLLLLSVSGWAVLRQWHTTAPELAAQRTKASAGQASEAANSQAATTGTSPSSDAALGIENNSSSSTLASAGNATEQSMMADQTVIPQTGRYSIEGNKYAGNQATRNQGAAELAGLSERGQTMGSLPLPRQTAGNLGFSGGLYPVQEDREITRYAGSYSMNDGVTGWNGLSPRLANLRGGWLNGRPDTLKASLVAAPQPAAGGLAATQKQEQAPLPTKQWRRLRLGASYAATSYNPNINFSRNDGLVTADLVTNALRNYYQEDAETEYRRNLRAGLGQRVVLTAAYTLRKRWALVSGVEASEQRATSATSYGFVDGRQTVSSLANNSSFRASTGNVAPAATRKTSYRYRSVAVPVEIRYGSAQPGASLYAKVGAAVGLLIGSRSELDGSPEATSTYLLSSANSPYRKVQASMRGGAGVRYQPTQASWSLALGTTTEFGLTTLNATPSQPATNQSRPYSVGVEAVMEFGSSKPMLAPH